MDIELKLINPTWINGKEDDCEDQCAHGNIKFLIGGKKLLDESEEFTVSAAALFLLRSLFSNHSEENPVSEGNILFPCCGFSIFETNSRYPIMIMGCPSGVDVDITHSNESVIIKSSNIEKTIPKKEWFKAVTDFASQVLNFYSENTKKVVPDDDEERKGWELFWKEFHELKNNAEKNT